MGTDFQRDLPLGRVEIAKVNGLDPTEQAVRLYCYSISTSWRLQVRGRMRLKTTTTEEVVVASADLRVEDLRALRDAITLMLTESGLEEKP
jgi:hypothetical protein